MKDIDAECNGETANYSGPFRKWLPMISCSDLINVDVNLQCTDDGATDLHIASQNGHVEVIRALLENESADVNLQMTDGATALFLASQNGHLEGDRDAPKQQGRCESPMYRLFDIPWE
ncbi:hypothetical protein MHU86_19666 [Fragilaria crotonensis]|nr:hypothetical protein MHU86_19666 [Fragilaria crotonensis]